MRSDELKTLLEQSRRFNAQKNITGMLLYRDGNFMQAIEGEEDVVRELYARIRKDKRHHGVITLLEEAVDRREFGEWSMGLENLDEIAPESALNGTRMNFFTGLQESAGRSHRLLAGFFDRALR